MEEIVLYILNNAIRPVLMEHDGDIELVEVTEGVVKVKLLGSCSHCPSAMFTMEELVESTLKEFIPGVKDVLLISSVSEDLMEQALSILRKK